MTNSKGGNKMHHDELKTILAKHLDWLSGMEGGEAANLQYANLQGANLQDANLQDAKLQGANLQYANLQGANLQDAKLQSAKLQSAKLQSANLQDANLQGAKLQYAKLQDANLQDAKLSGATGLLFAPEWLADNFATDQLGVIVYKAIGNTHYSMPSYWDIQPGQFITEVVAPSPTQDCGCGVNFATPAWLIKAYGYKSNIWKCRIHWIDLSAVVVPYNTDGKARCGRLQLLETIGLDDLVTLAEPSPSAPADSDALQALLSEWLREGRFMVANTPELDEAVKTPLS